MNIFNITDIKIREKFDFDEVKTKWLVIIQRSDNEDFTIFTCETYLDALKSVSDAINLAMAKGSQDMHNHYSETK